MRRHLTGQTCWCLRYEGFNLHSQGYQGFRYRGCPNCLDKPVYEGFRVR